MYQHVVHPHNPIPLSAQRRKHPCSGDNGCLKHPSERRLTEGSLPLLPFIWRPRAGKLVSNERQQNHGCQESRCMLTGKGAFWGWSDVYCFDCPVDCMGRLLPKFIKAICLKPVHSIACGSCIFMKMTCRQSLKQSEGTILLGPGWILISSVMYSRLFMVTSDGMASAFQRPACHPYSVVSGYVLPVASVKNCACFNTLMCFFSL